MARYHHPTETAAPRTTAPLPDTTDPCPMTFYPVWWRRVVRRTRTTATPYTATTSSSPRWVESGRRSGRAEIWWRPPPFCARFCHHSCVRSCRWSRMVSIRYFFAVLCGSGAMSRMQRQMCVASIFVVIDLSVPETCAGRQRQPTRDQKELDNNQLTTIVEDYSCETTAGESSTDDLRSTRRIASFVPIPYSPESTSNAITYR